MEKLGRVSIQGRRVIKELESVLKGRIVSLEVKKELRDSVLLPTVTYGSEMWTANEGEMAKIQAVEMGFIRSATDTRMTE